MMRNFVDRALSVAIQASVAQLFESLESTIIAGCQSPHLLLRPVTQPALSSFFVAGVVAAVISVVGGVDGANVDVDNTTGDLSSMNAVVADATAVDVAGSTLAEASQVVAAQSRRRVLQEIQLRQGVVIGSSRSQILDGCPIAKLSRSFIALRDALSATAVAFSGAVVAEFCGRRVDTVLATTTFTDEEQHALETRHSELSVAAEKAEAVLQSCRLCAAAVRDALAQKEA
jgi:hypothetical protein